MPLKKYKEKRDFARTPEPEGELDKDFCETVKKKYKNKNLGPRPIYVIQKHAARRLHFDLRLEMDGVLKSWAIPKEPPKEVGVRRLAVETEDHPLEYSLFSGTIPKDNYGAGKVELWDRGSYISKKCMEDEIIFSIRGKKLKGNYCLI
ncbi:MAG: DNA polymerase ligase N-terminal domain-containing protein, partial [Nanoarchaeota archaeon]